MERKECANGLQLIKVAAIKIKGHLSALFVGALAMTTPLILALFIGALMSIMFGTGWVLTVAVILFAIFIGPLQMGYIKYFNNVLDGKQPRIKEVYSYISFKAQTLRSIYIAGLLMIMYIFGGILWMVPAGFAISFFSMTLFFLQKFEHERMTVAMRECATKMIGNRLAMFSYKLIFYIIYAMLFVVAGLSMILIYTLLLENFFISWIVAVCSAIIFIFFYTFITVYFHASNQIFFEDVLSRDEKKRQRKIKSQSNTTQSLTENKEENVDVNEEKSVEQNPVEDKKEEKKTKTSKTNKNSIEKTSKKTDKKKEKNKE